MEKGRVGHRYILGGEPFSTQKRVSAQMTAGGCRKLFFPVPGSLADRAARMIEFFSDHVTDNAPSRYGRRRTNRATGSGAFD